MRRCASLMSCRDTEMIFCPVTILFRVYNGKSVFSNSIENNNLSESCHSDEGGISKITTFSHWETMRCLVPRHDNTQIGRRLNSFTDHPALFSHKYDKPKKYLPPQYLMI